MLRCRLRFFLEARQKLCQHFRGRQKAKKFVLHRWRARFGGLWVWGPNRLPTSWHSLPAMLRRPSEQCVYDLVTVEERLLGFCGLRYYAHKHAFRYLKVRPRQSGQGDCVRESAVWLKCARFHKQPHWAAVNLRWDRLPIVRITGRLGLVQLRIWSAWGKCLDRLSQTVQVYWAWDFSWLHQGHLLPSDIRHVVVLRRCWRPSRSPQFFGFAGSIMVFSF